MKSHHLQSAPLLLLLFAAFTAAAAQEPATLTIDLTHPGPAISPLHNGIFFEDINFAADGGLYPERIKNRSFEFTPDPLIGWEKIASNGATGTLTIAAENPIHPNNPHYLHLAIDTAAGGFGLENEGFRNGIGVTQNAVFTFSCFARTPDANPPPLKIQILSHDDQILATADLAGFTNAWKKHSVELTTNATDPSARIRILLATAKGALDLDMISLFPSDTFNRRENGLRPDLVQLLKDLHPAFMRFPGGCIVEGHTLANRYQWKQTIGPLEQRKLILNRWNDEFKHRPAPDYFQSFGLGFYEYFLLCEDIGAKPLPVLNCGMACQFNSKELCPLDQLQPYVQDALDLIEFANGSAKTQWGGIRASLGHPAPFNLELLGVGNEQWGQQYIDRYKIFAAAIKAQYPRIKLISAAGPSPDGKDFDFAWKTLRALDADIIDEHYYKLPAWFPANAHRYDKYDRNGPKVFAGEFAAQSVAVVSPKNRNDWNCALSEAAFMTGLARNADIVVMSAYAPLLAHVDAWQWRPNLIWFDNLRSVGTTNYYVQQLFSQHRGTQILPITTTNEPPGLYTCAAKDQPTGDIILKIVNTKPTPVTLTINLQGPAPLTGKAKSIVLANPDLKAENSLEDPRKVAPTTTPIANLTSNFNHEFPPHSLTALRIESAR
jgi:alpha-N-arabinofuranosidase